MLPQLYELELPSTGKTIKFRPFLVKEEKLLVLALESDDTKEITNAIKAVLKDCIQTRSVKVETLPTFDIEYLFLNIRGKSVGEDIEVSVLCPDDGETYAEVEINIDDIKVTKDEEHTKQIKLDETLDDGNEVSITWTSLLKIILTSIKVIKLINHLN